MQECDSVNFYKNYMSHEEMQNETSFSDFESLPENIKDAVVYCEENPENRLENLNGTGVLELRRSLLSLVNRPYRAPWVGMKVEEQETVETPEIVKTLTGGRVPNRIPASVAAYVEYTIGDGSRYKGSRYSGPLEDMARDLMNNFSHKTCPGGVEMYQTNVNPFPLEYKYRVLQSPNLQAVTSLDKLNDFWSTTDRLNVRGQIIHTYSRDGWHTPGGVTNLAAAPVFFDMLIRGWDPECLRS